MIPIEDPPRIGINPELADYLAQLVKTLNANLDELEGMIENRKEQEHDY